MIPCPIRLFLLFAVAASAIASELSPPRVQTSAELLLQVDRAWDAKPEIHPPLETSRRHDAQPPTTRIAATIDRIVIPQIHFSGLVLSHVVEALSEIATQFDNVAEADRGVNFVLLDPSMSEPEVTLSLRNVTLRRVLEFITASIGYEFEIQPDAVVIHPKGSESILESRFFPVSRATVLRLTGRGFGAAPQTNPSSSAGAPEPSSLETDTRAIRSFLQSAGVSFDSVPGATLAFDGSQLIVAQTAKNLARVDTILTRYRELRQVEIEAKFMEVQEGALEELGVQWRATTRDAQENARVRGIYSTGSGATRSLNEAFSFQGQNRTLEITVPGGTTVSSDPDGNEAPIVTPGVNVSLPVAPPSIPGGVSLGSPTAALAQLTGVLGEFDVNAIVRALQQRSGTELLSAPKLTVLSGNAATITVAQELRYPQSYGQIQSQVGTGSVTGGGSAGVSITSGTPQDFVTRNVGVELRVTPTVEEDGRSISLDLHPKVTEFEGFVEYGGPSVAISGGTTVTVPPGFYQPIFAVREVTTRVTLWDGATLIMGGLTREDVKKVQDKVPILGSLPLIGRLFRSEGESTQKRNLLIFVTARLVDPSGAPVRIVSEQSK